MPPDDWLISRVCEEFGVSPSEAVQQPVALTLRIMELRAYARAKEAVERAQSEDDATEWQKTVVFETMEEIAQRRQQAGEES